MNIPSHFQKAYTEKEIALRTTDLGREIRPWVYEVIEKTGQQPLAVCILRGGVYFFADLLRSLKVSVEPTFCRTWSYSSTSNNQESSGVRFSVSDVEANGRGLLLVDDICDTGSTLKKLCHVFRELGAAEIRTSVLIHRRVPETDFTPDYIGFQHEGDEWFVGYGMEDKNHHSNLRDVFVIDRP